MLRVRAAAPAGALSGRASSSAPEKKQSASRAAFFELCIRRGSKGAPARRRKDRCAPSRAAARDIRPLVLLLRSSKSLARLGCSLINAFTTPHCRYQLFAVSRGKVLCIHFPSCRERTPRRSKDRCAPSRVVTRDIRSLVLLLLSEKSHAASLLLAYKCARDAPTCYQLFSVSGGQADFIFTNRCRCERFSVSGGKVSSCRERTPRRRKDRCAPSRVVTRDIRPLVVAKTAVLRPAW